MLQNRLVAGLEPTTRGVFVVGAPLERCAPKSGPPEPSCHIQVPKLDEKKAKKAIEEIANFRIVKRELNLMRSMQQGISTHYNTRFGI